MSSGLTLSAADRQFLTEAAAYLERPSFLMRVANLVGKPAEGVLKMLPASAQKMIGDVTNRALRKSLDWAVRTLPDRRTTGLTQVPGPGNAVSEFIGRHGHTALAATTGAVGGLFGMAGAPVEVPTTTMVMLRSIANIAAKGGADLHDPLTRLHCLAVFSLGSAPLDKMESAYLTTRIGMALALQDAAVFFAKHTAAEVAQALSKGTAPVLVRLINQIASRFEIVLTEKFAAQAVPLTGAAMGALINAAFTDHFNRVARFHFEIVRMEQLLGSEVVQEAYREACDQQRTARVQSATK